MEQLLNLKELGDRLHRIDMLVVALLRRRIELDLQEGKPSIQKSVATIDRQLAEACGGAYIIAIGQKK